MDTSNGPYYGRGITDVPTEGPLTEPQLKAVEAWCEMRVFNAMHNRFRDLMTAPDPDEATIRAEAERDQRCLVWVVEGKAYDTGEEVGHFCPGYYDCLRCYPD